MAAPTPNCCSTMQVCCSTGVTYVEAPSLVLVTPAASQGLSGPLTEFQHPGLSSLLCCAEATLKKGKKGREKKSPRR